MTRDEVVARVQRGCGNRTGLELAIQEYIRDIQVELENEAELPWFLRTEISSVNTVVDEERVAKPQDFLAEWEDDALWFYDTAPEPGFPKWLKLEKAELDGLRQDSFKLYTSLGEDPANPVSIVKPRAYAFDGFYFRIFPTPDKVYQLRMIYYAADTVLTTNIENKWLKYVPEIFVGMAGQRIGSDINLSDKRMARFVAEEDRGRRRILAKNVGLQMDNRQILMGGADN